MVKRQRSFDGRGGVGWREKYVKEGLKIYVIISNISGKGINKEKILRGNFFLSSRVTYHQQVGYRESCVYYTKKSKCRQELSVMCC